MSRPPPFPNPAPQKIRQYVVIFLQYHGQKNKSGGKIIGEEIGRMRRMVIIIIIIIRRRRTRLREIRKNII